MSIRVLTMTGEIKFEGDVGPRGLQGEIGPQGNSLEFTWNGTRLGIRVEGQSDYTYVDLKGDTGEQGPIGPQGIQGQKGDTGERGLQGIKGDTGERGPQGIQGERGLQGEQGIQGPKGDKGDTGIQGPQGIQGIQGPKGDTGEKGDKGDTGSQGPQGVQGIQGATGNGISSVSLLSTEGKVKTYRILFTNGNTFDFQVSDGEDGQGSGDMLKAVYDTDNDGIVDNAKKVNNHTVNADVPANAEFTDTINHSLLTNLSYDNSGHTGFQKEITSTNKLDYSLISNTPTIPTVPTNVSAFTNDTGYITNAYHDNTKVDKETGKGLSTNDYTTAEKNKLAGIDMTTKQDTLVSGTNIKTINNQSILGSGNIDIQGGGGGNVNDVKVNGTSVVDEDKVANVTVPVITYSDVDIGVGAPLAEGNIYLVYEG